jgi:DNA replication and repair protein RecF
MFLKRISLAHFKNYLFADMELSGKINCFVGDNGMGKTNLLDAMYYLSFSKSYFNPVDYQNIMHGEDFFRLQGTYHFDAEHTDVVELVLKRNQRKILKLNKKEYERMADHIGLIPMVMISPSDSNLIYNGSDERRKFMDGVISQFDKYYLSDLINYNKALAQRNKLLKMFAERGFFDALALEVWDTGIIELGKKIHEKRSAFIRRFTPVFGKYFRIISGSREETGIEYLSQLNENDAGSLLQSSLRDDRAAAYTTAGIHKDDLIFTINGFPLRKFGSQGQQKSYLVAVKLAQFDYTCNIKGYKPILLFDDLFDKLDDFRVEQLLRLVSDNHFGQICITDTSLERMLGTVKNIGAEYRILHIEKGAVAKELNNINGNHEG